MFAFSVGQEHSVVHHHMPSIDLLADVIDRTVDNTFIGTLFAGLVLGYVGIRFYHQHKRIDDTYEDLRKLKESASKFYGTLNIAAKWHDALINFYDTKHSPLKELLIKNPAIGDVALQKTRDDLHLLTIQLPKLADDLIGKIKLNNRYDFNIDSFKANFSKLSVSFMLLSAAPTLEVNMISSFQSIFNETMPALETELKKILEAN